MEEGAVDRANTPPQFEGQEGGQATGKRKGCASEAAVRNPGSVPLGIKPNRMVSEVMLAICMASDTSTSPTVSVCMPQSCEEEEKEAEHRVLKGGGKNDSKDPSGDTQFTTAVTPPTFTVVLYVKAGKGVKGCSASDTSTM